MVSGLSTDRPIVVLTSVSGTIRISPTNMVMELWVQWFSMAQQRRIMTQIWAHTL